MSSSHKLKPDTYLIVELIMEWLSDQITTDAFMWLSRKMKRLKLNPADKQLHMVFNVLPQRIGKHELTINENIITAANSYKKNWCPVGLHADQAARIAVILNISEQFPSYVNCMEKIINHANENSLIALYRGLPLYPNPDFYLPLAVEGINESRKPVFEALIHNNPFPFENFNEDNWNTMVLHAVSLECSLESIIGLEERMSPELAAALFNYANECLLKKYHLNSDIWKYIIPFADESAFKSLKDILEMDNKEQQEAIIRALHSGNNENAIKLLNDFSKRNKAS